MSFDLQRVCFRRFSFKLLFANWCTGVENTNIALKDSVYSAIGLGAPVLEDKLDFATFLNSTLVPEIQSSTQADYILRRRIAIVLGQWLPVKSGLDRPLVYQIFQHLLEPNNNDKIVRITAGRQLRNIVDPFEFDAKHFKPFAIVIIERLLILINELELTDTKMALLNTLSVIVVRMELQVGPLHAQSMVPTNKYRSLIFLT